MTEVVEIGRDFETDSKYEPGFVGELVIVSFFEFV